MSSNQQVTTYRVDFLKNQKIPVRTSKSVSQKITGGSIVNATLNATIDFGTVDLFTGGLPGVKALTFNGSDIPVAVTGSTNSSMRLSASVSVRHLVVRNGDNTVVVNLDSSLLSWLNPLYWFNIPTANVNVWLDVEATGSVGVSAPTGIGWGIIPWWAWAVVALLVLAVVAWFLLKTNKGGKLVSLVYGSAQDAGRAIKGVVA